MKILKTIFNYTLISKAYNTLKYLNQYISDRIKIGEIFYGDSFKNLMKQYINIDLDKDWLGRLYGVINPNIDINGKFNVNNI